VSEAAREILICLVAAHFLSDFILQTDADAARKRNPLILVKHAAIVAATSYLLCGILGLWQVPLAIFVIHGAADFIKTRLRSESVYAFLADQAMHLGAIGAIVWVLNHSNMLPPEGLPIFWVGLCGKTFLQGLVLVTGLIASVKAGGIVIGLAVKTLTAEPAVSSENGVGTLGRGAHGLENGGKIIGYLERGLIFLFILMEYPGGIGFLIAAKSILRFGEVKDRENRMQAEYIIIGTFMSYGYGILIAYLSHVVLNRI
jgi:hypothetical protein